MRRKLLSILSLAIFCLTSSLHASDGDRPKLIVANPMNLNYRFMIDGNSRREAADPVIEYFKGRYYLCASKSGGYWSSPDLCHWNYIRCRTITNIENYAPTAMVYDDELYFFTKGDVRIFKTNNPEVDNWEQVEVDPNAQGGTDVSWFKDDDGKVYLYWGCSNSKPIMGVEVDPKNKFKSIGERKPLIMHRPAEFGWEVEGDNNETGRTGWNEGPCVIKWKGKYYLQYATPGTQFRTYSDAVYISDHPLGPFECVDASPFSFKPGGFIAGAGHGHTFKDKYGNYWHVATMKISRRQNFERRLGLFPVYFGDDDRMYTHTVWTDYPYAIPTEKVDFSKDNCSLGWNVLSHGKKVTASSELPQYEASCANDEQVESWWAASSGKPGEWWEVDLGKTMEVRAIQVNLADHNFMLLGPDTYCYRYKIEYSSDGAEWQMLVDYTANQEDRPHDLIVLDKPVQTRFIRITNTKAVPGNFSLYDFRVFGNASSALPQKASGLKVQRDSKDKRIYRLTWNADKNATGYIVRWGIDKEHMNYSKMVYTNSFEGRLFRTDMEYQFSIDAFNESGVTLSDKVVE